MECGSRQSDLSRKFREGHVSSLLTEELAKLLVQRLTHPTRLANLIFRMWNICLLFRDSGLRSKHFFKGYANTL